MMLSPHFALSEFLISQTASRLGLDNTPSAMILQRLGETARELESVRALLDHPILISSGYRSEAVNAAVGGAPTSAHTLGYAADFTSPGFGKPVSICKMILSSNIQFDQLIQEGMWVHISFDPRMRHEYLIAHFGHGPTRYTEGPRN